MSSVYRLKGYEEILKTIYLQSKEHQRHEDKFSSGESRQQNHRLDTSRQQLVGEADDTLSVFVARQTYLRG